MRPKNLTVQAKLAMLLVAAMILLAGTRGIGLIQLGGYLDRMNSFALNLDELHLQLEAAQERRLGDAANSSIHNESIKDLRIRLQAKRDEMKQVYERERRLMYGTYTAMLVLVFVVSGGIYWLLMGLVIRPLQGMAKVANVVAAGDLSTQITVKSADEIGEVMSALREMNTNLGTLIGKIRNISQSIGASTQAISSTSGDLSQHVEAQSAALQKTASTMGQLATTVSHNAENAGRARELAAKARDVAIKGGEEVGAAVKTMANLRGSSQKIGDIVSIIDGITFQTNILALNAAVEAARAGEQGRGFGVVAAEVRNLAQRSSAAAKEIAALINVSVNDLRNGGDIVEKAGATMTEIVDAARAVDNIMADIASASLQQRHEIEQVSGAIERIDQSSQQQALLVHAAQAAESMQRQAERLIEAVSAFRLGSTESSVTPNAAIEAQRDIPKRHLLPSSNS